MNSVLINANDVHQLADDMGDMAQEIIFDLVDSLQRDIDRSIAEMRDAVIQQDAEKLRQAAHRLKSSCANLGAELAASLCQELESIAAGGGVTDMEPLIDRVDDVCAQSVVALRNFRY
jgi:HPt (histidine-containing phosphotransfer) domain-containing protein